MSVLKSTSRRTVGVLAASCIASVVLATVPAHADSVQGISFSSTSTGALGKNAAPGGQVTRSQVIARAQDWVDQYVPYSSNGLQAPYSWWSDAQTGGRYRQDCSGLVSMAWQLKDSPNTGGLPSYANAINKWDMQPGDVLNSDQHVVIFAGWRDKNAGTFNYYQESSRSRPTNYNTDGNLNASTLSSHPMSGYTALRYKNIVDDPTTPPPAPSANNRTVEAIVGGALHEIYTDANGWHDSAVPGVGNLTTLGFAYNPAGQRVIEAVENGALHEIYTEGGTWHDSAVPVSGTIDTLGFAYNPNTGQRVIEAVEGGVLHEIYADGNGWHDSVVPGVGGNISALGFAYTTSGDRVIEAVENGALHEIYSDANGWHDSAVAGVSGNISTLGFAINHATGQRVIEAVVDGTLHEIYSDGTTWRDNVVPGISGTITSVSVKVKNNTGDRVIEAVIDGTLHEIYTDASGWHDGVIPGTPGGATGVSFDLTI
ncbi:hypothetical protein ACFYUY_12675 [Kitasatospora sp. NPDC004745]|uniref:hypothetical protein n=1 Tax=Kitasatospora sp. NPDC004745 TaxID=3364019 RepID=UPI00368B29EB